jgi:hypothetical protein
MTRYFRKSVILLLFLIPPLARSQSDLVRLEGRVQDATGKAVATASVSIADAKTGRQDRVTTDADGHYLFLALPSMEATLTVEASGFKKVIRRKVALAAPGVNVEDFQLEPRTAKETLVQEINLKPPIRRSDSQTASGFSSQDIQSLPLISREPLSLVTLEPGVQISTNAVTNSSVNGTRQTSNAITLDGISVSDPNDSRLATALTVTTPDSLSGVRVITSGAPAEYSQPGAQVKALTRTGGNVWSGSMYEYFRTKVLNAGDFFSNAQYNPTNPSFGQNIFGGSFGGPIKQDKTQLFVNYEGRRGDRQVPINCLVLTPLAKSGIFQWYVPGTYTLKSYDMFAADPRKLGIDPTMQTLVSALPAPNNENIGDGLNTRGYWYNSPTDVSHDQVTARLDHAASSTHHLYSRFSWDRRQDTDLENNAYARYPGTLPGTVKGRNFGAVAGSDWTPGPRTANELRFGYSNWKLDTNRAARPATGTLIPNAWTPAVDASYPRSSTFPILEASDSFTFMRGQHIFKAGALFRRTIQKSTNYDGTAADIHFGRGYGNIPTVGPNGLALISAYDRQQFEDLYNNLLGRVEQITQTFYSNFSSFLGAGAPASRSFRFMDSAAFLQDDWKVRPNFLLSFGVRYEWSSVPTEQNNLQGVLDKAAQMTTGANLAGISVAPGSGWYSRDMNNFAPRAGFSWDLRGDGRTVIRGSYGMFFDRLPGMTTGFVDQYTPALSQLVTSYPNLNGTDRRYRDNLALPAIPSTVLKQPPATRSMNGAIFDPALETGYIHQFTLGVQREVIRHTVLELAYVGSRATNLFTTRDLNQTRVQGDFLQAFKQLQAFRANGTAVPPSNTLVKIFGSTGGAIQAIGGSTIDQGLTGLAADTVDRTYYGKYAAAGVSDFYLRAFPQFNQLFVGSNGGRSWYDSLQVGLRRNTDMYSVAAHFTWSKFQDTIPGTGYAGPIDNSNYRLNKAPSDPDRPFAFNAYGSFHSPIGRSRKMWNNLPTWIEAVIGSWDFGATAFWVSGQRFSVFSGAQTAEAGVNALANYGGNRYIGQVNRLVDSVYWFTQEEINSFTEPAAGDRGTSGRNSFQGPEYMSIDASLYKSFPVGEHKSFLFRGECLNVFNRANFGLPITSLNDQSGFGRITTTVGSPRALQVSLRFNF